MALDRTRVRKRLALEEFERLFVEELGWDRHRQRVNVEVDGTAFTLHAFAHKHGFVAFHCPPPDGGSMPEYAVRRKIEWRVARTVREHLIVYTRADGSEQRWQWVKRERDESAASREWPYYRGQSGEALIEKLEVLAVELEEEEEITLVDITERAENAFDVDTVSQQFYRHFKEEHDQFYEAIEGIAADADREWYTSLMLNRLMFVYFIQKKGFLDDDPDYLRTRLRMVRERVGEGEFLSFYRHFLLRLFYEGLGTSPDERTDRFDELLGTIPYLNGGLFLPHPLEERYPEITIPDEAFADLFDFFDQYHWHLDLRPLRDDHEINPDVLGYIFEQFVNQKQMGAYYTKEDITGHMAVHSVGGALVDRIADRAPDVMGPEGSAWSLLTRQPDRYVPDALAHGAAHDLPEEIARGRTDPEAREGWSTPADDPDRALATETWREVVDRRRSYEQLRGTMERGDIRSADAMVAHNLPIERWLRDVIGVVEDPAFVEHVWRELERLAVCDIACGSGAFLFATLSVLKPLYDACLDRMEGWVAAHEACEREIDVDRLERFRAILDRVEGHPSEDYYVLKTITVNNLFGVDIMEEAVEICKLRLFLKLVAQIDHVEAIEALPDIDFQIRPGNSLVGFATSEDIERAMSGELDLEGRQARIEEDIAVARDEFRRYRELQTADGIPSSRLRAAKTSLSDALSDLQDELDTYLASEYGIDPGDPEAYESWRTGHQPFHWLVEFHDLVEGRGGFDVVIGNPPYVQYREVRDTYTVRGYRTESCRNLYAMMSERALELVAEDGRFGFIIPVSSISSGRYTPLRELFLETGPLVISSFNDRPGRLFEGLEHCRLSIVLAAAHSDAGDAPVHTTRYHRWYTEARPTLFEQITYVQADDHVREGIPKIGTARERSILEKVYRDRRTLDYFKRKRGTYPIYFTRKVSHYLQILDFVPEIRDADGQPREPSELKTVRLDDERTRDVWLAVLNSALFFWHFTAYSDCRNLNKGDVYDLPFDVEDADSTVLDDLVAHARALMDDLQANSQMQTANYGSAGELTIQHIFPKRSKGIIDDIDRVLARHYGLNAEELDFLLHFDEKFRTDFDEWG